MGDVIAVLDVGKTNKKVFIYNKQLQVLEKNVKAFAEVTGASGLKIEQPDAVFQWFKENLKDYSNRYTIAAISITTHGAMGVCVDSQGTITCPPLSYTNEPGQEFGNSFFEQFGDRNSLQRQTATAEIGQMTNFAKIIYYWKKHWPDKLKDTRHILFYPQYFGFKLTGNAASDTTMLGSHTYLYDHKRKAYSNVAHQLGVMDKLPTNILKSWDILGTVTDSMARQTGVSKECIVTAGIHDSNASLLPFLITETRDFVLNSTGTWCVAMKPAETILFKEQELGKTVFYNQDVFGRPVKTSIFMGGLEYETYAKLFERIHKRNDLPEFDRDLYRSVLEKCDSFILPSVMKGAGLFPGANPTLVDAGQAISLADFRSGKSRPAFADCYERSMAVLICSLSIQTCCALDAVGYKEGGQIFIEGGFRFNEPYLKLLTALYPKSTVYKTNINEATALGSAILAQSALEGKDPRRLDSELGIEKQKVEKVEGLNVDKYKKHFIDGILSSC